MCEGYGGKILFSNNAICRFPSMHPPSIDSCAAAVILISQSEYVDFAKVEFALTFGAPRMTVFVHNIIE